MVFASGREAYVSCYAVKDHDLTTFVKMIKSLNAVAIMLDHTTSHRGRRSGRKLCFLKATKRKGNGAKSAGNGF